MGTAFFRDTSASTAFLKKFMEDYIDYIEKLNSAKEPYRGPLASLLRGGIAVPALSATAMKLVALAEDEKSSLEDIEAVISLDPGLVSRCLQIACTSSYSRQPITEIRQALLMLGQRQVRQVAFTSEVMSSLAEFKGDKGDKWEHYWLHSLLTARLADQLARAFNQDTGLEYLAGLLHDCGEIFMARYFPKDWNELRSVEFEDPDDSIEIEDKQFGVNHAQVSAAIAQTLGLHSKIVRAIAFHHSPPHRRWFSIKRATSKDFLPACISMADRLAHLAVQSGTSQQEVQLKEQPGWDTLAAFKPTWDLQLDLGLELQHAQRDLGVLL
jgi:putative nucleotidyltransferase with HDIG domain